MVFISFELTFLIHIPSLFSECWPGMIKCDGCRCVDPQDADVLCLDRQGSTVAKFCNTRPETKFKCNNGVCVLLKWILDGRNDCGDWSDESKALLTFLKSEISMQNIVTETYS